MKKFLLLVMAFSILFSNPVKAEYVIDEKITETPVTKGVVYKNIKRFTDKGWSNIHLIEADIKEEGIDFKVLANDELTKTSTVEQFAKNTENVIAAVNADFFTNYSGKASSEGMLIKDSELMTTPSNDPAYATLAVDEDNNIFTDHFKFNITVTSKTTGEAAGILFYNKLGPVEYLKVYDKNFGKFSPGSLNEGIEVLVQDGVVTEVHTEEEGIEIPENGYVLSHSLKYSTFLLDNFKVGDRAELDISVTPEISDIKDAVGGGTVLIKDGKKASFTLSDARNPLTAVGYNSKDKILYLLNADGRNDKARGMTFSEAADFLISYGCTEGISFDGGGSTAMAVEKPGEDIKHVNIQSYYRPVTNAVGITAEKKEGKFSYISISTDKQKARMSESISVYVYGYDEYMNDYPLNFSDIKYSADKKGRFEANVFYPEETGKVTLKVSANGIENKTTVTVMENEVPSHFIDKFYKHTDKEGYTIGFFGDNGDYKTLFTELATAKRNKLAGETDIALFRRMPLGDIGTTVKALNYYWQMENEYGAFVSLNNTKGSILSSDSSQWEKFLTFIQNTKKENIFIMFPNDINSNDSDETEILIDRIKKHLSKRNVFIISYGNEYKYRYDDGIRYISLRDLPDFDRTKPFDTLSLCQYGVLTFNEEGISFEFIPYFLK